MMKEKLNKWEKAYKENKQMNRFPWSDVVSLTYRYSDYKKTNFKVLELGFGSGANIPLFEKIGAEYYGLDFSPTAQENVIKHYPHLQNNLKVGNFLVFHDFNVGKFDLVLDRAAITHNSTIDIALIIEQIKSYLSKDGIFIGVDWFGHKDSYSDQGEKVDDYTVEEIKNGYLGDLGKVHFANESRIRELFCDFEFIHFEEKIVSCILSNTRKHTYNFVVRKK